MAGCIAVVKGYLLLGFAIQKAVCGRVSLWQSVRDSALFRRTHMAQKCHHEQPVLYGGISGVLGLTGYPNPADSYTEHGKLLYDNAQVACQASVPCMGRVLNCGHLVIHYLR
ncbi:hypothetical protein N657DRAFT_204085 [Parathielavia appendiculata]|uniref:Uncharacterized protein n=1 Tax=Parathielavia appendiculata TaxID=2587402 RepID=A0AAN6U6R6_9PEZI|nr:hypothetical protein N657DRAFT_204085 [Parathielavia appendiculata]